MDLFLILVNPQTHCLDQKGDFVCSFKIAGNKHLYFFLKFCKVYSKNVYKFVAFLPIKFSLRNSYKQL